MDLDAIHNRLKAELTGLGLRDIGQVVGLDAVIRAQRPNLPAVYLIPLTEQGGDDDTTGDPCPPETRMFGVIHVLDLRNDTTGAKGAALLKSMRAAVKQALIGWVPEAETGEPVWFVGGELVQFEGDGRLYWSDEFVFKGYFRSTP